MEPLEWKTMGRERFERIVEALTCRVYHDADVRPLDGRGGDHGRDIEIRQGSRLRISQLKYFPEGFSGGFGHRRKQITKSWKAVRQSGAFEWILVVPCNLTDSEYLFLGKLTADSDIRLMVWDRANLDAKLAQFPDLVTLLHRDDQLRRDAVLYNQERAILHGGTQDLTKRLQGLGALVDSQDPHWTIDFSQERGMTIQTLRPKHPNAAAMSPVTITMSGQFGPEHSELRATWEEAVDYGFTKPIVLPSETVDEVVVSGPEWLSHVTKRATITMAPLPGARSPHIDCVISLRDAGGRLVGQHSGEITRVASGVRGAVLEAIFHEALHLRMTFDKPKDNHPMATKTSTSTLHMDVSFGGTSPSEARKAVAMSRQFGQAAEMQLHFDGFEGSARLNNDLSTVFTSDEADALEEFLADVAVVQEGTGQFFRLPDEISNRDRVDARFVAMLLKGDAATHPVSSTAKVVLAAVDPPVREAVAAGTALPAHIQQASWTYPLMGHELEIGHVMFFHPETVFEGSVEDLDALESDKTDQASVRIEPGQGHFFVAKIIESDSGELQVPEVRRWNLAGINEPGAHTLQ